jgi:hypothetical protein
MPKGGKRPGAGRPKGRKDNKTLDKEAMREELRRRVAAAFGPLIDAQISNAQGIKYLVTREKGTGKFIRVTEAMARHKPDEMIVEVWEKDPAVQAFTDLMNRALDKPKEQEQAVVVTGGLDVHWKETE